VEAVTRTASHDGREAELAEVGGLEVVRLRFPSSFSHGRVDPPRGYVAIVLDGAVCKSFQYSTETLSRGSFMSIPAGAAHWSRFGDDGCTVLVLRAATPDGDRLFGSMLASPTHARAAAATSLGRQLVHELQCPDRHSQLAVEGLAIELLARAGRIVDRCEASAEGWLDTVRELIHESSPRMVSLQELGVAVERHPAHVARAFRRAHGLSITAYARALRMEWATAAVASTEQPLARVAMDAGFADQSHFTRWFKRHHGVTPGRYRSLSRM
jgi:AraC family transcriptional regulator